MKSLITLVRSYFTARKNARLVFALEKLSIDGVALIDIGAAGDIEPRWKAVERLLHYIGFEPDDRSRSILIEKQSVCKSYTILPSAVWDRAGEIEINLCRKPTVSSHYIPNREFLDLFPESDRFDVQRTISLPVLTVDSMSLAQGDFIKLDIQGGELNALRGASKTLDGVLGLEIEVEFLPIYKGQPLFGDVCKFLAEHGFEFIDFLFFDRWARKGHAPYGQCVFADALFLRPPEYVVGNVQGNMGRYLFVCLLYNRFDLLDKAIELLPREARGEFDGFLHAVKPIRDANQRSRFFHRAVSGLIRTIWGREYHSHLVY